MLSPNFNQISKNIFALAPVRKKPDANQNLATVQALKWSRRSKVQRSLIPSIKPNLTLSRAKIKA